MIHFVGIKARRRRRLKRRFTQIFYWADAIAFIFLKKENLRSSAPVCVLCVQLFYIILLHAANCINISHPNRFPSWMYFNASASQRARSSRSRSMCG